jgi:hypothetical protein
MPNNKLLYIGRFLYLLQHNILIFIIPVYVYKITGEKSYLGIIFAMEWGVRLISLSILPSLLKSNNYIKSIYNSNFIQGLIIFSLFYLYYSSNMIFFLISIGVLSSILFDANFLYVENHIQNNLKDKVLESQSLFQSIEQLSLLIGPMLAGLLIEKCNIINVFLSIALGYMVAGLLIYLTKKEPSQPNMKKNINSIKRGFYIILKTQGAITLIIQTNAINIIFSACISILPAIVLDYKYDSIFLGWVNLFISLVSISSIFLYNKIVSEKEYHSSQFINKLFYIIYVGIIASFFQYFSENMYLTITFISITVIADSIYSVALRTKRQLMFNTSEFKNVLPAMMLLNAISFPIGGILISIFTRFYSAKESVAIVAIISFIFISIYILLRLYNDKRKKLQIF